MATATEVIGRYGNISGQGVEAVRVWVSYDATSEADATGAVVSSAPATVGGLVLDYVSYAERVDDHYECELIYRTYKRRDPPPAGESQFNFDVSIQPVRIVVPLTTTVYKRTDDPLPIPADYSRWLIGDQGAGDGPEGADIYEPATSFSETHWVPNDILTLSYRNTILRLVGKVNNSTFKGFDSGEILVAGISGARRGADDTEMTFRFMMKENQTNITVAGVTGINKEGWQYLWPRYFQKPDEGSFVVSNVVRHIVVNDVFRKADLSALGIGV